MFKERKTLRLPQGDWERIRERLVKLGYTAVDVPYAVWAFEKDGRRAVLYPSGVLVVEGRSAQELYTKVLHSIKVIETVEVGCDEAGKGDVFGPLVACCCAIKPKDFLKILEISPKDSKAVKDDVLIKKAQKLKELIECVCKVLEPKELNELYKGHGNLNRILDKVYTELIGWIKAKYTGATIFVDAYSHTSPLGKDVVFEYKGERHVSVSVASMVARAEFLSWLREKNLPKGSSKESMHLAKGLYIKDREKAKELLKLFFIE